MAKLKDDQISWNLNLDAKGVQAELTTLSSRSKDLTQQNKLLQTELQASNKQMRDAQKEMARLEAAGKKGSEAYKELKATVEACSGEITQNTKLIAANERQIKANNKLADEMVKTLGIEDMTMQQLRRTAKELQLQLDRTAQSSNPEQFSKLDAQLKAVRSRMGELKAGTSSMSSVLKGGLMVMTGNLMTKGIEWVKQLVIAVKEFVQEGIRMAKVAEGTITAFKKLGDSTRIMNEMKKATSGTISELELMKQTLRANEMGIPIEHMAQLLDYARRQAIKLGKDVTYMSDSIVDGIGRKSTLVLDNLGLSATRIQAQVKKTGDFTQAVMQIVNQELKKAGNVQLTAADQAAQAAAKWENAQLKVGKKFQWMGEIWDKVSGNIADNISNLAGETDSLSNRYQTQIEKVADLQINAEKLAKRYDVLKGKISLNKDEQTELTNIMNSLSQEVPGVVSQFGKYGEILSINTDKVYDYIEAEKEKIKVLNADNIEEQTKKLNMYTAQMKILEKQMSSNQVPYYIPSARGPSTVAYREMNDKEYQAKSKEHQDLVDLVNKTQEELNKLNGTTWEQAVKAQRKAIEQRAEFYKMNKTQLDAWIKDEKNAASEYLETAKQTYRQRFGDDTTDPTKAIQQKRSNLNKITQDLETKHKEKLASIRQKYLDGEIKSEAAYNRQIFAQEQAYNLLRVAALEDFLKQTTDLQLRADINNQIADIHNKSLNQQIKYQQELEKIITDADPQKKEMARYENELRQLGLFRTSKQELLIEQMMAETQEEKAIIQKQIDTLEILEKQHADNMYNIREQENNRKKKQSEDDFKNDFATRKEEMQLELNNLIEQSKLNPQSYDAQMAVHIQRIKMINEEIEARKKYGLETANLYKALGNAEGQMTSTVQKESNRRIQLCKQYAQSIGTSLGKVITGQEDALRSFADTTIDILFDVLQQIINVEIQKVVAAATAATAITAANQISKKGFAGIATAAVLTAAITGAMAVAKSALKGMLGKKKSSTSGSNSSTTTNKRVVTQGYAEGGFHNEGYTGEGDKYQVKGYFDDGQPFHAGEYIIPKWMMPLPSVAPVVRNLETIRRQKSKPVSEGYAEGGIHQSINSITADKQLMSELLETMKELRDKKIDFNIYEFERKKSTADNARKLASRR